MCISILNKHPPDGCIPYSVGSGSYKMKCEIQGDFATN